MFKWLGGLVDSNEKVIKRLQPLVDEINDLEPEYQKLSDEDLKVKTAQFKAEIAEATAEIKQELEKLQKELEEARKALAGATESEREEANDLVESLQDNVKQVDEECRQTENEMLEELLPEAFAAVREAARRTIGQRHFDVQLMGGIVLHQGKIAEMKTGEGKTLVATLPLYLNALTGRGAHLVTVNDYLARRDPYWMGPVYHALGLSVASIYPQQAAEEHSPSLIYDPAFDSGDARWPHFRPINRKQAYEADITYGTSSDFGFDYLRDNMVVDLSQYVQRPLNYAIVDEVDNLLIDEARTPLIISGQAEEAGKIYVAVNDAVARLTMKTMPHEPVAPEEKDEVAALEDQFDFIAFEKERVVKETTRGQERLARSFGMKVDDLFGGETGEGSRLMSPEDARMRLNILSIFRQSMIAHALYQRDRDYVVDKDTDGKMGIIIIDEFTGRRMLGRRYSDSLHQAIEAKEKLTVRRESLTFATVTIQNYFRMYKKLAGMTGTALTEAEEFHKIYKLEVVVVPTNKPMIRQDFPDRIYKDEQSKFKGVVQEVEEYYKEKRPVLIGTVSIEKSEMLSELLKRKGIPHQVLNAKYHEREAGIIAQAGRPGAVTVATNMAGRGVDIVLGGNPQSKDTTEWQKEHDAVIALGGLHIIGTERHEARRIDNQLRGRAGRQGDPGSSRFYVSLGDDIVKRFGGDRVAGLMAWAGMDENTPIENKLVNRSIEGAQVRVEGFHFDVRKNLVEYDDVVNQQRELIYAERHKVLSGADLKTNILSMVREEIGGIVAANAGDENGEGKNMANLVNEINAIYPLPPQVNAAALTALRNGQLEDTLVEHAVNAYEQREKESGPDNMRVLERLVMLRTIDSLWIEHLTTMEQMRLESGWQTLQQVKAIDAYKKMGYEAFQDLLARIRHDVARTIFHVAIVKSQAPPPKISTPVSRVAAAARPNMNQPAKQKVAGKKVGRNDPCPCGSGKKYKHCCGR